MMLFRVVLFTVEQTLLESCHQVTTSAPIYKIHWKVKYLPLMILEKSLIE